MHYVVLVALLWASVAEAAWVRYFVPTGAVTCVSAVQNQPCVTVLGQDVVDIPLSLLTNLNQPGTCELLPEDLAPFLRVTAESPFTLGFVSPIVCFLGRLVTSVEALHALRGEFDRLLLGNLSPALGAFFAIRCLGISPAPPGCPALRTRLQQELPTVQEINDAYMEFDSALGVLTGGP
jgi:hypothetical protein